MSDVTVIDWILLKVEASTIYFEPVSQLREGNKGRNGVLACPAVISKRSRTYTVNAPYDLRLRFTGTLDRPEVRPVLSGTSITFEKLRKHFSWSPRDQWASPASPVFQITTPYLFSSGSTCFVNQSYPRNLIGMHSGHRLIEGRFPIHKWLRPLSWAVEWVDPGKDIAFKRGRPWFDVSFETSDPASPIVLRRQEMTPNIEDRLLETKDVASYIRGTAKLLGE